METIGKTTLKIPAILILASSSLLILSITTKKAWRIFTLFTVNDFQGAANVDHRMSKR